MLFYAKNEQAQGLLEYALIIMLIAIVVIVALQFIAEPIGNMFSRIGNTLDSAL